MRKAQVSLLPVLFVAAVVLALPLSSYAQNREKFVISARAGGVNTVTGRAHMRPHGNTEWKLLTIKEDLETGDVVRTGADGRVEVLLNPGSYMRIAENSELELTNNSLEDLELRLVKGTAIVEVTGTEDQQIFIGITTPHANMSIIRHGLYRVNVVPGDNTELIVRKGRVMLGGSHTKVDGGNKVVFSSSTYSVAKLQRADKEKDEFEEWSKDRGQTLAKANNGLPRGTLSAFAVSLRDDWSLFGRPGFWLYNSRTNCYTYLPYTTGSVSPYGGRYGALWTFGNCPDCQGGWRAPGYFSRGLGFPGGTGSTSSGSSAGAGSGSGSGVGSGSGSGVGSGSSSRGMPMIVGKPQITSDGDGPRSPTRDQ